MSYRVKAKQADGVITMTLADGWEQALAIFEDDARRSLEIWIEDMDGNRMSLSTSSNSKS